MDVLVTRIEHRIPLSQAQREALVEVLESMKEEKVANPGSKNLKNFLDMIMSFNPPRPWVLLGHLDFVAAATGLRRQVRVGEVGLAFGNTRVRGNMVRTRRDEKGYKKEFSPEFVDREALKGRKVLDVGCGGGEFVLDLLDAHIDAVGLDQVLSPGQRKSAAFVEAQAERMPFADDSFDVVYTTNAVLLHGNPEQQRQSVQEIVRVTRSGGAVYLDASARHFLRWNSVPELHLVSQSSTGAYKFEVRKN